jgi:hypothetical protein
MSMPDAKKNEKFGLLCRTYIHCDKLLVEKNSTSKCVKMKRLIVKITRMRVAKFFKTHARL